MALVEAMLLRLPTIAFRVGPIPEIISDSSMGLLTSPGNADELSQAMLKLYFDKMLRTQTGENGYNHAIEKFTSMNSIIPLWEGLYTRMSTAKSSTQIQKTPTPITCPST